MWTCGIVRGKIQINAALYEAHLDGVGSAALLVENGALWIYPVRHAAAGGHLLKLRNAAGDRLIDAVDLFRLTGIDDLAECEVGAVWDTEKCAIRLLLNVAGLII